jgi:hypothetical protein
MKNLQIIFWTILGILLYPIVFLITLFAAATLLVFLEAFAWLLVPILFIVGIMVLFNQLVYLGDKSED